MQETPFRVSNKQANMAALLHLRSARRLAALPVALLILLLTGCARPEPLAQPLVGNWRGTMTTGGAAVPCRWEIRADGTQSLTLTLPQGAMAAQGTWMVQNNVLTQRTTARVIVLSRTQKTVQLASPMETAFAYQLRGDALTLTRPDTHQQFTLARERRTGPNAGH